MARRDVIKSASKRQSDMEREHPDFIRMANDVINEWGNHPGENYLVTAVAEGLRDAYALGLSRSPLPSPVAPTTIRRTRPTVEVTEVAPVTKVARRRTRS